MLPAEQSFSFTVLGQTQQLADAMADRCFSVIWAFGHDRAIDACTIGIVQHVEHELRHTSVELSFLDLILDVDELPLGEQGFGRAQAAHAKHGIVHGTQHGVAVEKIL